MSIARWLLLLSSVLVLLGLLGCAGLNSLTGGSVPIGEVDGWVYRSTRALAQEQTANQGLQALALTPVELELEDSRVLRTSTDEHGYFIFRNVPKGHLRIRAGNAADLFAQVEVDFDRQDDRARVAMTMAPRQATLDIQVQAVQVTPAFVTDAHVGDNIVFTAGATGPLGASLDVPVSWGVRGDIGTITLLSDPLLRGPRGVFRATRAGTGLVVAQFRDLPPVMVPVTVLPQVAP